MVPDGTQTKIEREKRVKRKKNEDILSFRAKAENNPVGFTQTQTHTLHNTSQAHSCMWTLTKLCYFLVFFSHRFVLKMPKKFKIEALVGLNFDS